MANISTLASEFIQSESAGGVLLIAAALLAVLLANSPLAHYYDLFIATPVQIRIGPLEIAKPLLLWVNDGLMAGFFFLVGLELKRELLIGELRERGSIVLPALGALGGMLAPALIYLAVNRGDPVALRGWAIPTATDIAFALGILSLLGPRVPVSLKVLLTSLAIFDDIGAILIIAIFYTESISLSSLSIVACCLGILLLLNRKSRETIGMYVFIGSIMWVALLKSGVHATLAGILLAMFIPLSSREGPEHSPLMRLEHDLESVVAYFILPIFAFCNSGLDFAGGSDFLLHPVPIGIALGLFLGKQLGVFSFFWFAIRLRLAAMPGDATWSSLYGLSCLCGIGFTMSLFIGTLAFDQTVRQLVEGQRLGIIAGSLVSGLAGYFILRRSLRSRPSRQDAASEENHQP